MPLRSRIPKPVQKATQALNYFARQYATGEPRPVINRLKALKLLFFADRFHIRKYGRPVSECNYFAMGHGPVASEAKCVAEDGSGLVGPLRDYARRYLQKQDYDFESVAEVETNVLSASDLEALDFAWQNFGHYTQFQLRDITHHYPEWKRHEKLLRHHGKRRVPMDYTDFFQEPDAGYNPCHPLTAKERSLARELFIDRQDAVEDWR